MTGTPSITCPLFGRVVVHEAHQAVAGAEIPDRPGDGAARPAGPHDEGRPLEGGPAEEENIACSPEAHQDEGGCAEVEHKEAGQGLAGSGEVDAQVDQLDEGGDAGQGGPAEAEVVGHAEIVEVVEGGQEQPEGREGEEPVGLGEDKFQGEP